MAHLWVLPQVDLGAGVLCICFVGWSMHAMCGILREAMIGWCILEEELHAEEEEEESLVERVRDIS